MRKLLPSTIKRREDAQKNREAIRMWMEELSRIDIVRCKTPQDPYSDERDYELIGDAR